MHGESNDTISMIRFDIEWLWKVSQGHSDVDIFLSHKHSELGGMLLLHIKKSCI